MTNWAASPNSLDLILNFKLIKKQILPLLEPLFPIVYYIAAQLSKLAVF